MHTKARKSALAEGITAGIFFGSASIFIRFLQDVDAFSIAFWRLIIAILALAAILVFLGKKSNFKLVKENLKSFAILGVVLGLHFIFFISAVKDTTVLNATVLVNTTPIFSMFISSFLFKVKPSRLAITGLLISFTGVFIIAYAETMLVSASNSGTVGFSPSLKGDLEAVLAAVVEAFYLNYGKRIRNQMNLLSAMLPIYVLTAIVVGVLSIPFASQTITFPDKTETFLFIVGLGLLPTAVAHTLYFSSMSSLKSFETATMALLEPVGATFLGVIIFQETPANIFLLGAGFVLLGIFFVAKEK